MFKPGFFVHGNVVVMAIALFFYQAGISCQTSGSSGTSADIANPPKITASMPLEEALSASIRFGGSTLVDAKRLITKRKQWETAAVLLKQAIFDGVDKYNSSELINAMSLYQASPAEAAPEVFDKLIASDRPLAKQLGWQLAAMSPSPKMALAVDRELSRALRESDEKAVLVPEMASAVQANRLRAAYTYLRQGLFTSGHENFAVAMAAVDPWRSSNDFMTYLAKAQPEELRQISISSVNVFACMFILRHLVQYPVDLANGQLDHLFYYAVSRNPALQELGAILLESYFGRHRGHLAYLLSRLPTWAQVAYIESAKRLSTPAVGLFLAELKKLSTQPEVVDEIDQVRR